MLYEMLFNEDQIESGVNAISLVGDPAIESLFVAMSKATKIQLAEVDKEKKILMGAVLIPDINIPRMDNQGNKFEIFFSKDTIRKVMESYHANLKNNNATLEHQKRVDNTTVIESWIKEDMEKDKSGLYGLTDPIGTWYVTMKINNDKIWDEFIKTGNVKGFSIEGMFTANEQKSDAELKVEEVRSIMSEFST